MLIFNYVLILLAAILLSNLINHFLPSLSVPLVQIILGVLIVIIPFGALRFGLDLEPELFFVLFLSPLVFHSTMTADKKAMRMMLKPIVMAAVGLVFLTILIVGYFSHLLIPAIPLAAAFALAAALGPTDVVAVEAISHRVSLPHKIVSILSGESIINDATGIVCFQFAIVAVATGSFSLLQGLIRFLVLAIGGLLVGLILTILKYILVRWLRSLDMNTASLHISIGIMTPFIIYMVAEELGMSGILAVFGSGLVHSLYRDKFNPEVVNLNNAQENVWSVLSFSLDGLVFVLLGTQLPRILQLYTNEAREISGWQIVGYVLLISLALTAIRFAWWVLTVRRKIYDDPENPIGKLQSGMIFSIAGARGAVPMASVFSIPLLLPDGAAFPERDLIILIASGVIVVSLLMTNFILPLLVRQKAETSLSDMERAARAEILQAVVERLKKAATLENFAATEIITRNYYSRMSQHPSDRRKAGGTHRKHKLQRDLLLWEKDVVLHMAEMGQISKTATEHYIGESYRLIAESSKKMNPLRLLILTVRHFIQSVTWRESKPRDKVFSELKEINAQIMREKLDALKLAEDDPARAIIAAEHEQVVSTRMGIAKDDVTRSADDTQAILEVAANGFYMERVLIQNMLEAGRLSWKTAKEMQANIAMIEAQLHIE